MANLDLRVQVSDVATQLTKERVRAEAAHKIEKDEETRAYLSGQLDLLERLEAFIYE